MMSDKSSSPSKGRRKKSNVFHGDGIALLDRQVGSWGLLIGLALAVGLALLGVGTAVDTIAADLASSSDVEQGDGAVFGFLMLIAAFGFGLAMSWACLRLYRALQARSQIRLRLFTGVAALLSLTALAFFLFTERVLFYSLNVTVGYLIYLTFCALWGFAVNRSSK